MTQLHHEYALSAALLTDIRGALLDGLLIESPRDSSEKLSAPNQNRVRRDQQKSQLGPKLAVVICAARAMLQLGFRDTVVCSLLLAGGLEDSRGPPNNVEPAWQSLNMPTSTKPVETAMFRENANRIDSAGLHFGLLANLLGQIVLANLTTSEVKTEEMEDSFALILSDLQALEAGSPSEFGTVIDTSCVQARMNKFDNLLDDWNKNQLDKSGLMEELKEEYHDEQVEEGEGEEKEGEEPEGGKYIDEDLGAAKLIQERQAKYRDLWSYRVCLALEWIRHWDQRAKASKVI
ncbi:unnamed protein product [Protopolystoma xenopodis]|uniref:Uncharacterized protein n=1 Tax=Protopolystoma xenopodis TaxID=117903 RepID=A0A3S5CDJ3_9PLAT|nr:unnamed protein product [Protopolystoma xenopodis]